MRINGVVVVVLFGTVSLLVQTLAAGASTPGADPLMTLIPPSPVTDRITLDVRCAVRNPGGVARKYDLSFHLDEESPGNLLHRENLEVSPGAAGGLRFPWNTKGRAGDHKIILTVRSGNETERTTRPLRILSSGVRSTSWIDGAWAGIYHWSEEEGLPWNKDLKRLTDEQWKGLVRGMHGLRMDVIVVQEAFRNQMYVGKHNMEREGYKGLAFYPSRLFPGRMPVAANDPLEAIFEQSDRLGMHVFAPVGMYAWFDFTPGSLAWHLRVADELWERYGHHPSFYGWYVSEEIDGSLGDPKQRRDIVNFFKAFREHVRSKAPDKPVMLASNCHHVVGAEATYRELLPHLDILCPFGFHRMPAGDLTGEEAARTLQALCDRAGSHLWMDMEAFVFGDKNALLPRPIDGLLSDLHRFPGFEKILCYQYPGLLTAPGAEVKLGGESAVRLYRDYRRHLEPGQDRPR
jgi:hypothetical protein